MQRVQHGKSNRADKKKGFFKKTTKNSFFSFQNVTKKNEADPPKKISLSPSLTGCMVKHQARFFFPKKNRAGQEIVFTKNKNEKKLFSSGKKTKHFLPPPKMSRKEKLLSMEMQKWVVFVPPKNMIFSKSTKQKHLFPFGIMKKKKNISSPSACLRLQRRDEFFPKALTPLINNIFFKKNPQKTCFKTAS